MQLLIRDTQIRVCWALAYDVYIVYYIYLQSSLCNCKLYYYVRNITGTVIYHLSETNGGC